jgi:hypothetical protein
VTEPTGRRRRGAIRLLLAGLALAWQQVVAGGGERIVLVGQEALSAAQLGLTATGEPPSHALHLTAVVLEQTGWTRREVLAAVTEVAALLAPCRVGLTGVELLRVRAPARFHDFHTPAARDLARQLQPGKPTLYFVRDTRQQPAFDAEAIGRGNSRTRPELADSVWVTRAAPDVGIVLAHELVHVLADSGAHVAAPGNLMEDRSAPGNRALTAAQCAQLRTVGTRHGLLQPAAPDRGR